MTASRDLKAMVDNGLLMPVGERRSRHYLPSQQLTDIRERIRAERAPREDRDPFSIVRRGERVSLAALTGT